MWGTNCPDCGDGVFFFSCTCGSRIFFDSVGPPWPLHAERCHLYQVRVFRAAGNSARHARQLVESEALRRGIRIPENVAKKLRADEYAETGQVKIILVRPQSDGQEIAGVVISEALQVNFFKRLKYPDNAFSRGFLGKLAAEGYVELRVRADPDPDFGYAAEVECYLPLRRYRQLKLAVGVRVELALVAKKLPNDSEVWLVDEDA
jgi:hypothetical protein